MKKPLFLWILIFLIFPLSASGTILKYDCGIEYTGATPPAGMDHWLNTTFKFLSFDTEDPDAIFYAAHVQGIGADGGDNGWVTVPEPSTMVLLGFSLIGLAGLGRRKFKRS